jgi:predicted RND superfamily exporter protein
MAGFVGMAFSDHRGLASLGQTALIGLFMSLLAPLLIMPLIIGFLEEKVPVDGSPTQGAASTAPAASPGSPA